MLTYDLKDSNESLYLILYSRIRDDIINGRIQPGERLPSKRKLALNNGVSVITVENAYSLLLSEGYIYSKPRSGFFVSDISAVPGKSARREKKETNKFKRMDESHFLITDFTNNQTPPDLFPFTFWLKATRKVFTDDRDKLLETPPSEGILGLRQSIQRYLEEYRGLYVEPESIVIGAGSEYLYKMIISLIGRDRTYAIEDPGYRKIEKIYLSEGVRLKYLSLDENGVSLRELEDKEPDIIHITPSHQYPAGIVMPVSRRYELLAWASEKENRYIIEDDYDSELRLEGKPIPSLSSIDPMGRVIYINTFSKTLSSTVRISYMVLPHELNKRYRKEFSFYSSPVSSFEQYTLNEFMESGKMGSHIARMRTYYRKKRDLLIDALKRHFGERVEITGEKAGLYFLMHVISDKSEERIITEAKREGIGLTALSGFYHTPDSCPPDKRNTYVINYASLDPEKTEDTIKTLYRLFFL